MSPRRFSFVTSLLDRLELRWSAQPYIGYHRKPLYQSTPLVPEENSALAHRRVWRHRVVSIKKTSYCHFTDRLPRPRDRASGIVVFICSTLHVVYEVRIAWTMTIGLRHKLLMHWEEIALSNDGYNHIVGMRNLRMCTRRHLNREGRVYMTDMYTAHRLQSGTQFACYSRVQSSAEQEHYVPQRIRWTRREVRVSLTNKCLY